MKLKGNAGYGKMIADAVLASLEDPPERKKSANWLDSWLQPAPGLERSRRWLSMWLKGDLKDIPEDQAARYLRELAADLKTVGLDAAVDRFIDKILPRIIGNGGPEDLDG